MQQLNDMVEENCRSKEAQEVTKRFCNNNYIFACWKSGDGAIPIEVVNENNQICQEAWNLGITPDMLHFYYLKWRPDLTNSERSTLIADHLSNKNTKL